jgi:hypothetical protein
MPDLDIVGRSLNKPWRSPYRLLKGGHPPDAVGDSMVKALAATLRETNGMSAFEPVVAAFLEADSGKVAGTSLGEMGEMSRAIERAFGQQREAKLMVRAAQRTMIRVEAGMVLPGPLSMVREYLRTLVNHHFFDKISGRLVGNRRRFPSVQHARAFEAAIWASIEPQLSNLATRLIRGTPTTELRAPKSLLHPRSTAELLDRPVSEGIRQP